MPVLHSTHPNATNVRRLAQQFTSFTPFHHPFLDPKFPEEDKPLVPKELAPRGGLSWDLPSKAVTNNNKILEVTNEADEFLAGFHVKMFGAHERLEQMEELVTEWIEMRGSSPTKAGRAQLQIQEKFSESSFEDTEVGNGQSYIFNMVMGPPSPKCADVIYLTNPVEQGATEHSVPQNLRTTDWTMNQCLSRDTRGKPSSRDSSIPPNIRSREWADNELLMANAFADTSSPEVQEVIRSPGPYEKFWIKHDIYRDYQIALDREEELGGYVPRYVVNDHWQ